MRGNSSSPAPDEKGFLASAADFAAAFGWQVRSFQRAGELVAVVALDHDPSFEQLLWVYDTGRAVIRCLLVDRRRVPFAREAAILELCSRINDGLLFGCAEYSFNDRTVVFRDSIQLGPLNLKDLLPGISARVLDLGSRYAPAIGATLGGTPPVNAICLSEESAKGVRDEGSSPTR
jgi:hypothetical protein